MVETVLIENGLIFTLDENSRMLEKGAIIIQGDRIVEVGAEVPKEKYRIDTRIDAKNMAVIPGLVNTHMHSAIFAARGSIEDLLMTKGMDRTLEEFYYPFMNIVKPPDVYNEAVVAYLEAIRSGTTCVNDMYRHITACAEAAEHVGIRAVISTESADLFPGLENDLQDNERAFKEKNNVADGRVKIWFGVEWIPVCSPEFIMKTRELANKYHTGIHVHLNESVGEVEWSKKKFGKRPIEHVYDLGLLGKDVTAAHCVWTTDREIRILKETGTNVATCPTSNMKLGNGFARIPDMITAGVNVGIGTDAPNNNLDMFEAMKYASVVQRGNRLDSAAMPYRKILRMASVEGAQALGLEDVGSIEPGKKADLAILDLSHPKLTPVILRGIFANVLPNLVYSAHGDIVDTVIIDGKIVMQNKVIKTIDEAKALEQATRSAETLLARLDQLA
jgi:5-methylthioadenosine/S-adenosylhomocysteine deaminase